MDEDTPYRIGFLIVTILTMGPIFFAPTIVGLKRGKNVWLIILVNIFLGWTLLGWGVAMALAVDDRH